MKQENFCKSNDDIIDTNVIFSNPAIQSWDIFRKYKIDSIFLKDTLKELILYFEGGNIYLRFTYSEVDQKLKYEILTDINDVRSSYKNDPHYTWYTTWRKFPIFIHIMEAYNWKQREKDLIIQASSMAGEIYYIAGDYHIAGDRDISWNDKKKEFKIRDLNHGIISPITSVAYTAMLVKESIDRYRLVTHESLCILQKDGSYKEVFRFMFNDKKCAGPLMDAHSVSVSTPIPNTSIKFVNEKSIDIVIPESVLDSTQYMKFYGLNDLIVHVAKSPIQCNSNNVDSLFTERVYPVRIWYTQGHMYSHMLINPDLKKKEENDSKE